MVVLQKYYEFVDRPSSEISRGWKICHITFYIIATTTGFSAYTVFHSLKQQFGDNCILYPNITFMLKNNSEYPLENGTNKVINEAKTAWGHETLCDFCQYVPIMSMIIGCIFLTFFIMCPRGGTRHSQSGIKRPYYIVIPSLVLTGIFTLIMVAATIETKNGIYAFCAEFSKELNTTRCSKDIMQFSFKEATFQTNTLNLIQALFSVFSVCLAAWVFAFLVLLIRCGCAVADFKLMEVTISTIDGDKEENLEETEVLLEQNPTSSP